LHGKGILHLADKPDATPATPPRFPERVLAATSGGLFLGTRTPPDAHSGAEHYDWTPVTGLDRDVAFPGGATPKVCDVLWLPGTTADGVIVVAVCAYLQSLGSTRPDPGTALPPNSGVLVSTDGGLRFRWVGGLGPTNRIVGRMSLANVGNRVYVLGAQWPTPAVLRLPDPTVWCVPDITVGSPMASTLSGTPPKLWHPWPEPDLDPELHSQRDYCQAITVRSVGVGTDRVWLGGNWNTKLGEFHGSLWTFDVPSSAPGGTLSAVPNVSAATPASPLDGWVGQDVHADVHCVRVAATSGHVWVGTDGGVYASTEDGAAFTFAPRMTGLATIEVTFVAPHPTSTHYAAIGTQDNGRHMRVGDVVWRETQGGDGGGVAFHPRRSHIVVSQAVSGNYVSAGAPDFVDPLTRERDGARYGDREASDQVSAFYAGVAATAFGSGDAAQFAMGTNRVWFTWDLDGDNADADWRVLPYAPAPGRPAFDPRPDGTDPSDQWGFGVPQGPPLGAGPPDPLGPVLVVKWASETELLVVFQNGVVRWTKSGVNWSARLLVAPVTATVAGHAGLPAGMPMPSPGGTVLTDVAPVPGTHDFYLTTSDGRDGSTDETCLYFVDGTPGEFRPTGLRAQLTVPDPAHAVVVDPTAPTTVYVGTVSGVWRGESASTVPAAPAPVPHAWTLLANGLPDALVQDLSIFHDPAVPDGPRLLRAGLQSRGVWELDLTSNPEPASTYLRVHARDDRRVLPTPLQNPRLRPGVLTVPHASPDISVRPQPGAVAAPAWQFGASAVLHGSFVTPDYQLWTFQTAFRWHHPSILATGLDSRPLRRAVERRRAALHLSAGCQIDRDLWRAVVGGTRLDAALAVSTAPGDPLAVYQTPWSTAVAPALVATEVDLVQCVVPVRVDSANSVWDVFREPCTVDVLIHHRNSRAVPAGEAFVILLWRDGPSQAAVLAADADTANIPDFVRTRLAAEVPGAPAALHPVAALAAWRPVSSGAGTFVHQLPIEVDARLPRAVSINLDLSNPALGRRVALLAITASTADLCTVAPYGIPAPPTPLAPADLVGAWPYAALRVVKLVNRPAGAAP
jgi:hypothetical protein